jgi:hypothetical protein
MHLSPNSITYLCSLQEKTCKIQGSYSSDDDDDYLLGCDATWTCR